MLHSITINPIRHGRMVVTNNKNSDHMMMENFLLSKAQLHPFFACLPPVVRSIVDLPYGRKLIVIEQRPKPMTINFSCSHCEQCESDDEQLFTINIPWHTFFLAVREQDDGWVLDDLSMYWSKTAIGSLDHEFYTPPLTNIFANNFLGDDEVYWGVHNVCTYGETIYKAFPSLIDMWNAVYESFWHSTFNADCYEAIGDWAERRYSNVSMGSICALYEKLAGLKLETVCSDKFFKHLDKLFTLAEFVSATASDTETFDFERGFRTAYSKAVPYEVPKPKMRKKLVELETDGERLSKEKIRFTPLNDIDWFKTQVSFTGTTTSQWTTATVITASESDTTWVTSAPDGPYRDNNGKYCSRETWIQMMNERGFNYV